MTTEKKKNRHHYVPKFYLRRFSVNEGQIHLYNVNNWRFIRDAKLKTQCQIHKLYGEENDLEDLLMQFEGRAATAFKNIETNGCVEERDKLEILYFITQTQIRSPKMITILKHSSQSLIHRLAVKNGFAPGLVELEPNTGELMRLAFPKFINSVFASFDLEPVILKTRGRSFVTSDYPVIRNNSIYFRSGHFGSNAWIASGLQVFLPISPQMMLLMHDGNSYRCDSPVLTLSDEEVDDVNALHSLHCISNIYLPIVDELKYLDRRLTTHKARSEPGFEVQYKRNKNDPMRELVVNIERSKSVKIDIKGVKKLVKPNKTPSFVPSRFNPAISHDLTERLLRAYGVEPELYLPRKNFDLDQYF